MITRRKIKVRFVPTRYEFGVISTDMRPGYELYVKGLPLPNWKF